MSVETRRNKFGIAQGSTWGTAVTVGANNGLYPRSVSGLDQVRNERANTGIGKELEMNSVLGVIQPMSISMETPLNENCLSTAFLLALLLGADSVTGSADPYTHAMGLQGVADKFFTMIFEEGAETPVIPSIYPESLEIYPGDEGEIMMQFSGKGNKRQTGGDVSSLTYSAIGVPFRFENLVFRINAQSGDALDSDDAVEISDFRIRIQRSTDGVHVAGSDSIIQPKEGGYPEVTIEFKLPRKATESATFWTAREAGTLQKADLVFSGSSADRELKIELPQLKIQSVSNPHDEIISTRVECRAQKAAAAPTGMTGILVPTFTWKNAHATLIS